MRRVTFIAAAMVVLLFAGWAQAEVCFIVNGSFEDDGWIDDITLKEPNGWDVNLPADKFSGYVHTEWVTDEIYNLTLYSEWVAFEVNDMATLSQEVCLTDVNYITFDLKLDTFFGPPPSIGTVWDPNKCTAVLLIDGDVVWELNSVGSDARDEYYNQTYTVEDKYKVAGPNTLSFGMRVNVDGQLDDFYETQWDFIWFYDLPCRGGGLLAGDFDRDCYVDMKDLKMFTDVWLDEVDPNDKYNLFQDKLDPNGIINFLDFAIFADSWDGNMPDLKMFTDVWLEEVDLNHEYNLFQYDKSIINFLDFAIFADNWLKTSCEQGE